MTHDSAVGGDAAPTIGRRERKKQRTRQALLDAAVRLFQQHGYEQTTIAEIAETADVSTRTFFLHFPTKEDLLLANADVRIELGVATIHERRSDETPIQVLTRALERMITDVWNNDLTSGLAGIRAELVASSPSVRARLLQRFLSGYTDLTEALVTAYAPDLDEIDAAALVGAVTGAMGAAALTSLGRGDLPAQVRDAMDRAVRITIGR
ncbi:TetR family transcriptional regulator [Stackebrandtia endophytica]|uniref:TetR family transcriptional regulator n=1 Tax=Stackebrandtia endophytica TaxID=1496996 RepID=A0A543AYV6_9ACTN|nr:TetR/AcrR family transcriptional regulator [Stackebrandtia endophytica]TQL77756.1 TetR family transcriptional regulator [Stackebrandtia endophytica]